jgi:hypothetical protein
MLLLLRAKPATNRLSWPLLAAFSLVLIYFGSGGQTGPTRYVGHCLAHCTSPGRQTMMSMEQSVE